MNVSPVKLPYRGVLIERPCIHCNTVDIHFEGNCNSGPCVQCGDPRYVSTRNSGTWGHDYSHDHKWLAHEYFPADIVWPDEPTFAEIGYPADNQPGRMARRAFHVILDKVKEIGWPEMYTCDLFWDQRRLAGQSPDYPVPLPRFVWAVRSTGTDLFSPEQGIFQGYEAKDRRFFAYDGRTHGPLGNFVEMNIDTARAVLSVWRAEELAPVQPFIPVADPWGAIHS